MRDKDDDNEKQILILKRHVKRHDDIVEEEGEKKASFPRYRSFSRSPTISSLSYDLSRKRCGSENSGMICKNM